MDKLHEFIKADVVKVAPSVVYNEFNMQLLNTHAHHQQQQPPPAREEDDADRVQAV
jgi:hypothetical protein